MLSVKPYRPNVAALIVGPSYPKDRRVFVAERSDMRGIWQFPQGGIDEGETPSEALSREMLEEIGTDDLELIAEYPSWITYDFPSKIAKKMAPYYGQTQRYYLLRLKSLESINLETKNPEFADFKFIDVSELPEIAAHFKRTIYKEVVEYFISKGYL